jgi:hypothetical protein
MVNQREEIKGARKDGRKVNGEKTLRVKGRKEGKEGRTDRRPRRKEGGKEGQEGRKGGI